MLMEKDKMRSGEIYNARVDELVTLRQLTQSLLSEINTSSFDEQKKRQQLFKKLLGTTGNNLSILTPFYCDYGQYIHLGDDVSMNHNVTILDAADVYIGSRTRFGPHVHIYATTHPLDAKERATGVEIAKPVNIGDDAWIGGHSVIMPGVTVGERAVIGAGSIVTKNIPADVVAVGNPCRVIRKLNN